MGPRSIPLEPYQRPQTSHIPKLISEVTFSDEPPKEVKVTRPKTSHASKFIQSPVVSYPKSFEKFPESPKVSKTRVSFEIIPETSSDRRSSLKTEPPKPRTRRPQTPRFMTNLERIPEEPESIGDGEDSFSKFHSEDSFSKFNSEISNLKAIIQESIKGLKDNCEESQKALEEQLEMLDVKMKQEYQKQLESLSKDKTREIANLTKKNEALNTSLKHKTDEIQKLKREVSALKARSSIETASNRI